MIFLSEMHPGEGEAEWEEEMKLGEILDKVEEFSDSVLNTLALLDGGGGSKKRRKRVSEGYQIFLMFSNQIFTC